MKLSKRLKQIEKMVNKNYDHIWDCCCDHGFLGASLLSNHAAQCIHFVDIVPKLITEIENKLQQFHSNSASTWKTHCLDVAELPLNQYEGHQLVIIAGVGGDLTSRFVSDIIKRNPDAKIDFLLCPVYRQYGLRKKLIELDCSLKQEVLIEDKQRFYEVMLVSIANDKNSSITPIGDIIWQSETTQQATVVKKYLENTLDYYRRMQQGDYASDIDRIIEEYKAVKLR